jgi:hypothetical protein
MPKIQEVQERIKKTKLSRNFQDAIIKLLPDFGESVLNFVYSESQKKGFEYFGQTLLELLQLFESAQKKLEQNNSSEAVNLIIQAYDNPRWANGEYVLPWVLDLEKLLFKKPKLQDKDLLSALAIFKIKVFENLPPQEVAGLLENYAVNILLQGINLSLLLKKYVYLKHWDGDAAIIKPMRDALLSNTELLSEETVSVGGKNVPSTFANIFKNFNESNSNSKGIKTNLDVSRYVVSYKNISKENKEILVALFTIYLWMLNPIVVQQEIYPDSEIKTFVSEDEMASFIGDFEDSESEAAQELPLIKKPPVVPVPKDRPAVRQMDEISQIPNDKLKISNPSPLPKAEPVAGKNNFSDIGVMPSRVNIQDILNSRQQGQGGSTGLKMWDTGAAKIPNNKNQITNEGRNAPIASLVAKPLAAASLPSREELEQKEKSRQAEIDKKLKELMSRNKN